MIVFGISKESKLEKVAKEIEGKGIEVTRFCEPDLFNSLTAFATAPVYGDDRKLFERFCLLRG